MATTNGGIGYAEAEALKRRERILKLRKKVEGKSEDEENKEPDPEPSSLPSNNDDETQDQDTDSTVEPQKIENERIKDSILNEELDLNQLAPRKIDWDLKRGIERKLEMLQEATNNAIAELIRDEMVDDIQV
ncbi:coiled-coil domain-containing protein 12 [Planococcus citri]|uniref:coiled-coil domain-containing protein 12 n=1 Tax=Planococcus citri TaxID=170843 RepID=UPI0031F8E4BD